LQQRLASRGIDVILTREPGGAPGAEKIRKLLLTGDVDKWLPMTEVLLFYAARVDHIERTIRPAIRSGKWVITDRYADSTFAYQGAGHGLGQDVIEEIHRISTNDFWPDLTILLDGQPEQGLARANSRESVLAEDIREDRFEKMETGYHQRLRSAFLKRAEQNPRRIQIVSARGNIAEVSERIWQPVAQIFDLKS